MPFINYISHAIRAGSALCLDEKISNDPVFRMFADLDLLFAQPELFDPVNLIDNSGATMRSYEYVKECHNISQIVAKSVSSCFPLLLAAEKTDLPVNPMGRYETDVLMNEWCMVGQVSEMLYNRLLCMVSMSQPKQTTTDNGQRVWKVGIHFNWIGNIHVSKKEALEIRHVILENLNTIFGTRMLSMGENTWESAVDAQVYSRGIRIMGTHKTRVCKSAECKARMDKIKSKKMEKMADMGYEIRRSQYSERCKLCDDRGWSLEPSIYYPQWVLDGNGEVTPEMDWLMDPDNITNLLMATSLRTACVDVEPCYVRHSSVPESAIIMKMTNANTARRSKPNQLAKPGDVAKTGEIILPDDPICEQLKTMIHAQNSEWSGIRITKLIRQSINTYYIHVAGSNVHYCTLHGDPPGKPHKNNSIFFVCDTRYGLYQSCFDQVCKQKIKDIIFTTGKQWTRKPKEKKACIMDKLNGTPLEYNELRALLFQEHVNEPTKKKVTTNLVAPPLRPDGTRDKNLEFGKELDAIIEIKMEKYYGTQTRKRKQETLSTQTCKKRKPYKHKEVEVQLM